MSPNTHPALRKPIPQSLLWLLYLLVITLLTALSANVFHNNDSILQMPVILLAGVIVLTMSIRRIARVWWAPPRGSS